MSEMIERVALALLKFENMGSQFEVPEGLDKWPVIMNDRGKDYWRQKARAAIEAMREPIENIVCAGDEKIIEALNDYTFALRDPTPAAAAWQAMIDATLNEKSPAAT